MQRILHQKLKYLSALLLIILTAFAASSTLAQTAGGIVISNQATVSYQDQDGTTYKALSQIVTTTVASVRSVIVTPDDTSSSATIPQNEQATRIFTIKNTGNTTDSYIISESSITSPAEIAALYFDTDKSNTISAADERIELNSTVSPQIAPGSSINVLALINPKNTDFDNQIAVTITAQSKNDSSRRDSGKIINTVSRNVKLTAGDSDLPPQIYVDDQTWIVARSGQTVTYKLAFRNRGQVAARRVLLIDELPDDIEFIPGSLRLRKRFITDARDGDEGTINGQRIEIFFDEVGPDEVIEIEFQARIRAKKQNANISNSVTISGDNFVSLNSLPAVATVNSFGIVYAAHNGGSAAVPNARVTLATDANAAPLATAASGFSPNEQNLNPFTTVQNGQFNFTLGANQIGSPTSPGSYVIRVEAPDYRSRLIGVTVRPSTSSSQFFSATLQALDGQALAKEDSFELTDQPVTLSNLASIAFNIPLFENSTVVVEKNADRPTAEIGDVVTYRINVQNMTSADISGVIVRDRLPDAFIYAPGSAQIQDGTSTTWKSIEPEVASGNSLVFRLPALASKARTTLSYRVRVGVNARAGMHINNAVVEGAFPSGETVVTPAAQAAVRVSDGAFSMRQSVIGRVYIDKNGNNKFDANDKPIEGARIYTDKGQFVVTDSQGMYNLPAVEDGSLVLRLDETTLPSGLTLVDNNRREDKKYDRLLHTPLLGGSMLRQNFALKAAPTTQTGTATTQNVSNFLEAKKAAAPQTEVTANTVSAEQTAASDKTAAPQASATSNQTQDQDKDKKKGKKQQDQDKGKKNKSRKGEQISKSDSSKESRPSSEKSPTNDSSAAPTLKNSEAPNKAGVYTMEATEVVAAIAPGAIEIVSPKVDQVVMAAALELEARVAAGWTVGLAVNDLAISSDNIALHRQYHASSVDSFTFVGINLKPGANRVAVRAISPEGRTGEVKEMTVMGRGAAKRLEIVTGQKELQANGRNSTRVTVKAFDEWGNPALDGQVALSISQGNLRLDNESNSTAGKVDTATPINPLDNQVAPVNEVRQQILNLENGVGTAEIVAGNAPGIAEILAASGRIEVKSEVRYVPDLRPTFVVGVGEAAFGKSAPQMSLRGKDSNFHSRLGFFFRGRVFGDNLLTLSYDSERALNRTTGRDRLFELDPLERAYPVFGDSSTRFEEATSNSKIYTRLDHGRSYAMFGDFETELDKLSLSGYSRKLTGGKVHLENKQGDFISITGARPDTAFARDVFPGDQLGLAALSHPDILQGSEVVTLETRDRRNPEIIISREQLIRSVDYNLDPLSGQLFFLRPLSAFDLNLNLVQAVVTYEHYSDGSASNVYTARASKNIKRLGLSFGLSLVNQRQEAIGSFFVGGFDGEKTTFRGGKVRFEYATSRGETMAAGNVYNSDSSVEPNLTHNGNAYRIEVEQPLVYRQMILRGDFTKSDPNFLNPFGATVTPGTQRSTVSLQMKLRNTTDLKFGFTDERNHTENVDNQRQTASVEVTEQVRENLRVKLGYDLRRFNDALGEDNNVNSQLVTLGAEWKPTEKLQFAIKREQNLGEADPTYPNQTTIAAKYQFNNLTNVFFTQRLASDAIRPISDVSATGFGSTDARRETAFGVETKLMRYSTLSGRYQIENGINGTDTFSIIGLQNRLPINKRNSIEVGYERGFHLTGEGKSFNNVLLGYSWKNENFRSSVRYEMRDRLGSGSIFTAGAAGKLGDNMTVLGRFQYAKGDLNNQLNKSFQGTGAFAFRPLKSDRAALLFSYKTRSLQQDNRKTFERTTDRIDTFATDGLYQVSKNFELYGHAALKFGENSRLDLANVSTLTYLAQARAQYKLGKSWDVALEARYLAQPASFTKRNSVGAELGYWVTPDIRLGGGYNWTKAYQPPTTSQADLQKQGFYFTVTTKISRLFNLFGSEKGN